MSRSTMITGLAGCRLSPDEQRFLARVQPLGIILFARNIHSHQQVIELVESSRAAIGCNDVLVLIDQEGGRVQRLRPPLGRALPPAANFAALYEQDRERACTAAYLIARLLADDLIALGINCNCAPVLDIPVPGAHDIIGDRAYGLCADQVIALGRAVGQGFIHGSVLPVIKHIPGHGRARDDSHLALPVVETPLAELIDTDFKPFAALHDIPAAMSAHVVYSDIDAGSPASTSAKVTGEIIRGHMGFDGLLMSDDLSMKALGGPMVERAQMVIAAGSDVALHCNGVMSEMEAVAEGAGLLDETSGFDPAFARFHGAMEVARGDFIRPFDAAAAEAALEQVCAINASS